MNKAITDNNIATISKYAILIAIAWTVFVASVMLWHMYNHRLQTLEIAKNHAEASFEKDLVHRRWAAKHGGVYVPVTKDTPPNPYLSHIEERDITTPSGRQLTLMNPAYMTRQVQELGAEQYGLKGHITSLKPLRPENAPDSWEREKLEMFEKKPVEVTSVGKIDGQAYIRLIKPLITEQSCLKCHASQGYKAGDIRGGVSVSVPMDPLWAIAHANLIKIVFGYCSLWILGLIGIGIASWHIKNRINLYKQADLKFQTLYESSVDAVMLLDDKGFFDCNNATIRIFKCKDKADFCSKHPADFSPETQPCGTDSRALANERIATAMEKGSCHFEWIHQTADGIEFPADVLLSAMDLDDRRVLQAVVRDIREHKRAEENLRQAKMDAEAATKSKGQFLASMSHEIRTPMNSIIGFSDILADEELTDQQNDHVNMIRNSGKHLLQLINDILDFSKIEAGKLDIEMAECSLEQIFSTIESMMQPLIKDKNLEFKIQEDGSLPAHIYTDGARLQQCLINLVNNAIKFTETGYVHLNVSLELKTGEPYIRFDVEDTGIGISYEKQDKVFESFSQAESNTSQKYGGTGLGLAITKQLTELLGGEIALTSEEGKGSVFSLMIPAGLDVTEQPFLDRSNIDKHINIGREASHYEFVGHVLVAEDVETNQVLIKSLLQRMGLEVTIVADGNEAVQKAVSSEYDLIFMDIQMPNMNGYEATKELRKKGIVIPIIALTANAMIGDDNKCIEAGCDDYLPKPLDRRQLLEKIKKYLPSHEQVLMETADSVKNHR
ncbi:MAG: DUF3365 domain-containing protein [Planctomycetes bacterium]|nr:DUF3365 domain-containing protein [Planctomycetota bacterium]